MTHCPHHSLVENDSSQGRSIVEQIVPHGVAFVKYKLQDHSRFSSVRLTQREHGPSGRRVCVKQYRAQNPTLTRTLPISLSDNILPHSTGRCKHKYFSLRNPRLCSRHILNPVMSTSHKLKRIPAIVYAISQVNRLIAGCRDDSVCDVFAVSDFGTVLRSLYLTHSVYTSGGRVPVPCGARVWIYPAHSGSRPLKSLPGGLWNSTRLPPPNTSMYRS